MYSAYTAVAVAKIVNGAPPQVWSIFRDHLGSITHVKNGSTVQEYSFDAWGRRRSKDMWSNSVTDSYALFADRGFTGHEHLTEFGLINMNGRLYDPLVGRFLNPDNYVQDDSNTQNFNRYGYCLNNPLRYTDPSGDNYLASMNATYGEGNYWYRGQAPGTWGSEGSQSGDYGGGGSTIGRGVTDSAPSYEDWARKKNAETTWIQLGFYYPEVNGNPTTQNGSNGQFWIYEAYLNNYEINFASGYASNSSFPESWGWDKKQFDQMSYLAGLKAAAATSFYKDRLNRWSMYKPLESSLVSYRGAGKYVSAFKSVNAAKGVGFGLTGIGIGYDLLIGVPRYQRGIIDEWSVSPQKAGLNTGVALYSLSVNAAVGVLYFGIDAFYPGGLGGYMNDSDRIIQRNQQILGLGWNMYKE